MKHTSWCILVGDSLSPRFLDLPGSAYAKIYPQVTEHLLQGEEVVLEIDQHVMARIRGKKTQGGRHGPDSEYTIQKSICELLDWKAPWLLYCASAGGVRTS